MRVVVDTNVFVSGLMLPANVPGRILAAAHAGGFEIVLCKPILEEISTALHYPKVRNASRYRTRIWTGMYRPYALRQTSSTPRT